MNSSSDPAPSVESICSASESVGPMCRRAKARGGRPSCNLPLILLSDQLPVFLRAEQCAELFCAGELDLDDPSRLVGLLVDQLGRHGIGVPHPDERAED